MTVTRRHKPSPDLLGPPHPDDRGGSIFLRPLVWFLSALDRRHSPLYSPKIAWKLRLLAGRPERSILSLEMNLIDC